MKDTMRSQSVGIQQMEVRMEALTTAKEGVAAESNQVEGLITKLTDARSSAFNALRQSYGGIEVTMNERFSKVESQFVEAHTVVVGHDETLKLIERNRLSSGGGASGAGKGSGEMRESCRLASKM